MTNQQKSPGPSVDDLRQQLRDLGYLDAGVDRFVLGPVRSTRGLFSIAALASVRIGLLGGLLLGPSAAIALGVRLPGLVTGPRDAAVLALYLAVMFGVGVALLAFLGVLLFGAGVGRLSIVNTSSRRQAVGRLVAWLVAVASLVYLVLWWRASNPAGLAWASWMVVPVLAASAAISLLLGRVARVTALAILAHRLGPQVPAPSSPRSSWRTSAALGALAFVAAMSLLLAVTRWETREADAAPPRITVRPTGVRLSVVAVDGVDLRFLQRLAASGRTPRLARLLSGAHAVIRESQEDDPAATWTSIATGLPSEAHGVSAIEARRVSGLEGTVPAAGSRLGATLGAATDLVRLTRPIVASGLQRRAKTFWEVAAEHGIDVAVVNWWASWPAPSGRGVVLTDRATLRLERGGNLDAEIAPASLFKQLQPQWATIRRNARYLAVAVFPDPNDSVQAILRRSAEQDIIQVMLARRVVDDETVLSAVYLPGLDIAQFGLLSGPGAAGLPPSMAALRVEALERYVVFLDGLIAPLLGGPGVTPVLITDPGRAASRGPGLFVVGGAPGATGRRESADAADIAPTLFYLLGLPISSELRGHPLTTLLVPEFVARYPVVRVSTYGRRLVAYRNPSGAALDQEAIDRLKSLGYVR